MHGNVLLVLHSSTEQQAKGGSYHFTDLNLTKMHAKLCLCKSSMQLQPQACRLKPDEPLSLLMKSTGVGFMLSLMLWHNLVDERIFAETVAVECERCTLEV